MSTLQELLEEQRDVVADRGDLAETIRLDDELEDLGMHSDGRRTCWTCQSWADHRHDPLTGRLTVAPRWVTNELGTHRRIRRVELGYACGVCEACGTDWPCPDHVQAREEAYERMLAEPSE